MKLHTSLSVFLFLIAIVASAQDHFQATGNFTDAMNINILEAKVNGVDLEVGDEIGIFDEQLCVGRAVLDKSLDVVFDALTKSAIVGADDAETGTKDGFTSGGAISFRFWDTSENAEISVLEIKYYEPSTGEETSPKTFAIGATAYVSLNTINNYRPKSNAGPDQVLYEGESGKLDGTASLDLNGDSLTYTWFDPDKIGLVTLNAASPAITAPRVKADKDFQLILIVNDGVNSSEPDTTIVTVLNVPSGPVANAGGEFIEVNEQDSVILDGSESFDPDGASIRWQWELSDKTIDLINSNATNANFIAPKVVSDTSFYAVLTVTNSFDLSDRDTIQINVRNVNVAPVAVIANKNIVAQEGGQVLLDGSSSYDPDNGPLELSYQWSNLNGEELGDSIKINAVFMAPYLLADSVFLFTLTVSDGDLYSLPDTVRIKVLHTNLPPVANAGNDLVVFEGGEAILNGNASFDPEGRFLLYEWTSDYFMLDDISAADPSFIAGEVQKDTLVFVSLKVSDKELWSEPDTLWITVQNVNKTPEWLALPPDSAFLGEAYYATIKVYDPDIYDSLTISVTGLPEWLSFSDFGDGTAELFADTVPYINAYAANWEIGLQVSDGTISVDTVFVLHVDILTGIRTVQETSFCLYPNPTERWLTVRLNDQSTNRILHFYDAAGKLVKQQKIIQQKAVIDLSSWNKGVYFLELLENDKRIGVQKLVVN